MQDIGFISASLDLYVLFCWIFCVYSSCGRKSQSLENFPWCKAVAASHAGHREPGEVEAFRKGFSSWHFPRLIASFDAFLPATIIRTVGLLAIASICASYFRWKRGTHWPYRNGWKINSKSAHPTSLTDCRETASCPEDDIFYRTFFFISLRCI